MLLTYDAGDVMIVHIHTVTYLSFYNPYHTIHLCSYIILHFILPKHFNIHLSINLNHNYMLQHMDRYKETIVTIANREQEANRIVAAQKEELQ